MARLLLGEHRILIFDEPTEHLDRDAAGRMLADILSLRDEHAIVLISHSGAVLAACDEIVHIDPALDSDAAPRHLPARAFSLA
jgi:ABC-type transport system involved in cytochrome bd biosynthesis fused ATPase/permease subunit